MPQPRGLSLGTLNTWDIRGSRLAQAIQVVHIGGFDLMKMKETKITNRDYFCNRLGYDIVWLPRSTTASGGAEGGVHMVIHNRPQGWCIELTRFHGPKVGIWKVITVTYRNGSRSLAHTSGLPRWMTYRNWRRPLHNSGGKSNSVREPQHRHRPSP